MAPVYLFFSIQFRQHSLIPLSLLTNDMLTMTLSQHLPLHWLNLQIEATHTQDEGFKRDSRDQTCSLVFAGSVDLQ
jgi:hypothetical protein